MLKEFREFAIKGNAVDLAIGVMIGAAFGAVVTSLVNDVIMPPVGKLLGGVDFSNFFVVLGSGEFPSLKAAKEAGAATLNYGVFINTIINFMIIAFILFLIVRTMNRMRRAEPAPSPTAKGCPHCMMQIPLKATRCPHCTSNV
jgi:large conductance mechanosensitive channel